MGPSTTFSTKFQTIYPFFPLPSCFWNSHHKTDIPHHLCDFPCLMQAKLPIWDTDSKKIPISVGVDHIRNLDEKIFNWILLDGKLTAWSLQVHHSNPLSMSFQMIQRIFAENTTVTDFFGVKWTPKEIFALPNIFFLIFNNVPVLPQR